MSKGDHASRSAESSGPFLSEGRNCLCTARADRLAFLVDAQAYFRAFKLAAMRARHSILIVAWDVHGDTPLEFPDEARADVPNKLGPFLKHLLDTRDRLKVHILDWGSPLVFNPGRELNARAHFHWFGHPRLRFALDRRYPVGGSQHQKIVVIDDAVAFVGGLDLTLDRLDDRRHRPADPRRRNPDGKAYGPHHDVQVALDGPAARVLSDVARQRWLWATDELIEPAEAAADCWPDGLEPDVEGVEVGVARTYPQWNGRPATREIEALLVDGVRRAQDTLYIENQFFTATRVVQAILSRLKEQDCPEIVVVLPGRHGDWLEHQAIGRRQKMLIGRLGEADRHDRLRIYTSFAGAHERVAVKVHAKLQIGDGRRVQIGSANLANRSMGLDSECDIAFEAEPASPAADAVEGFRDGLIAEHLGVERARVQEEIAARGSMIAAIEALRGGDARTLERVSGLVCDQSAEAGREIDELLDPDVPLEPERVTDEMVSEPTARAELRRGVRRLCIVLCALLALAAAWRWGPLAEYLDLKLLTELGGAFAGDGTLAAVAIAAYVVGTLVMFPLTLLIAATGLLFGPVTGLVVAFAGSLASAVTGYGIGAALGREMLGRLAEGRLDRISRLLARRGVLSVFLIRLLPVSPFTLVNLAAGASHIRLRDFVLGSALGLAPGIAAMTLFAGKLGQFLQSPDVGDLAILIGLLAVIVGAATWSWKRFGRDLPEE